MNPLDLNKVFDNRVRLAIMGILTVNEEVNFNTLKELLQITDGNLASHLKGLEECSYIEIRKHFIGRKTNTIYSVTPEGKQAFTAHLNILEQFIKKVK
jgi:DNA-binding MarR family transcriptional regulator